MSSTIRDVKGLVAIVTGGASGLGEATVRRLVRNGAYVVICDLASSNGNQLAKELGKNCAFAPTDVAKETDVKNALHMVKTKFHKLDVVVNCAGIYEGESTYNFQTDIPHSLDIFSKVLHINTTGTFNVIRLAVSLMAKNTPDADGQKGVIINTASIAAFDGDKMDVAYSASKSAVAGMTLPLARDLACQGIRCCGIAPGYFDTPLLRTLPEDCLRELAKQVPFPKRFGKPDEFAHLVQSIVENPMLNGCVIRLDGAERM